MKIQLKPKSLAKSGFTLLEIIIVMVVIAIIIGGSFTILSTDPSDNIHILPAKIQQLAQTSLYEAKKSKRTQYIHLSPSHIWLSPIPDHAKPPTTGKNQIQLPDNCSIGYKRPNETQWHWLKSNNDLGHWTFSVAGLCEEFTIILKLSDSQSSAECSFHPLTGTLLKP